MANKYSSYQRPPGNNQERPVHPIWRGVGFGLMILTPILGYFGAMLLLQENARRGWIAIPRDLLVPMADPLLLVKAVLTLLVMFVIFAFFQLITFLVYRIFAPSRYGPTDVPPVSYRGRRRSR